MDKRDEQGSVSVGDQEAFLSRQNALGDFLDEEVQPWTDRQLVEAEQDASDAIRNVYITICVLLLAGLLIGALAAALINRGLVGSVRKLREGADRVGRGDKDHRST